MLELVTVSVVRLKDTEKKDFRCECVLNGSSFQPQMGSCNLHCTECPWYISTNCSSYVTNLPHRDPSPLNMCVLYDVLGSP